MAHALAEAAFPHRGKEIESDVVVSANRRERLSLPSAGLAHDVRARADRIIAAIDQALSRQVNAILHHPVFQAMESRWRGLDYLVTTADGVRQVLIRVLSVSWEDVCRDLERSVEFDQSRLFELIYSDEFGTPGGEPFGLLVGDYSVSPLRSFSHPTDDVGALRTIASVAAAAFCPFLASVRPDLLGLDRFADLDRLPSLNSGIDNPETIRWESLRRLEDTRFLGLLLPRILLRSPYRRAERLRRDGFDFREEIASEKDMIWGNAAFAFAATAIRSFGQSGWFADLRGAPQDSDGGGLVLGLPTPSFSTDRPGVAAQPPVEVRFTSGQERILNDMGLITVSPLPYSSALVFNGNPSLHLAPGGQEQNVNHRLSSMLQYVLCASRFAHHLNAMMRWMIGSLASPRELEERLRNWLLQYCIGNDDASLELKARAPLRDATVEIREIPGKPGVLGCILRLQPHFQLDAVAATFQLVTEVSTTPGM